MDSILGLISLSLLLALLYGPWQHVCTDFARQIIFEKRDAIFDLAAAGKMDFNSESYKNIRLSLERLIRFAHVLTFPRFFFLRKFSPMVSMSTPRRIEVAIAAIEDLETRKLVTEYKLDCDRALLLMMLLKSPLTLFLLIFALPFYLILSRLWRDRTRVILDRASESTARNVEREANGYDNELVLAAA